MDARCLPTGIKSLRKAAPSIGLSDKIVRMLFRVIVCYAPGKFSRVDKNVICELIEIPRALLQRTTSHLHIVALSPSYRIELSINHTSPPPLNYEYDVQPKPRSIFSSGLVF